MKKVKPVAGSEDSKVHLFDDGESRVLCDLPQPKFGWVVWAGEATCEKCKSASEELEASD